MKRVLKDQTNLSIPEPQLPECIKTETKHSFHYKNGINIHQRIYMNIQYCNIPKSSTPSQVRFVELFRCKEIIICHLVEQESATAFYLINPSVIFSAFFSIIVKGELAASFSGVQVIKWVTNIRVLDTSCSVGGLLVDA